MHTVVENILPYLFETFNQWQMGTAKESDLISVSLNFSRQRVEKKTMLYILQQPSLLKENFWQTTRPLLSAARWQKVVQYRFARDKNLSAAVFLLLRIGLMHEYAVSKCPSIAIAPSGKPFFSEKETPFFQNKKLFFSLSHCKNAALCALSEQNIGADAECWDSFSCTAWDTALAASVFSQKEQREIQLSPCPEKTSCQLWTRKESAGKFHGSGIVGSLPDMLVDSELQIDTYDFASERFSASVCRAHYVSAHAAHAAGGAPDYAPDSAHGLPYLTFTPETFLKNIGLLTPSDVENAPLQNTF